MAPENERYWLRIQDLPWQEVTADQWADAERDAGFRSTTGGRFATGGFGANGIEGMRTSGEITDPKLLEAVKN